MTNNSITPDQKFLIELANLMEKHNAVIELEHVWQDEYNSMTELSFKLNDKYIGKYFTTASTRVISHDEIES